jgi:hypothetical protein
MGPSDGQDERSWSAILVDRFCGDDSGPSLDVALSSDAEQIRLRLRRGRLELVSAVLDQDPDLAIRLRDASVREVLLGRVATRDLLDDARIDTGGRLRRIAPGVETQLPFEGHFPRIAGASLAVGIHVTSTVSGEVGICERWHEGALVHSEVVSFAELEASTADIRMSCSLEQLRSLRMGEVTPLDAMADDMRLLGEWPQLMCFVELMQHPAYRSVWGPDPTLEAEAAWGAVFCSAEYGDAALHALLDPVGVE